MLRHDHLRGVAVQDGHRRRCRRERLLRELSWTELGIVEPHPEDTMLSKSNLTFILLLFASLTIAVMASGLTPILEYWQFGTPQAANIRTDQPLRSEVPFGSGHEARAMEQKIEALAPDDVAHLEKQRVWVRDHYDAAARHQYETVEGKLRLLDTIIRSKWIEPSETWKLQSLGVTFGDALVVPTAFPSRSVTGAASNWARMSSSIGTFLGDGWRSGQRLWQADTP